MAPRATRIAAVVALACCAAALLLALTGGSGHTLYAGFDNVSQIAEGQEVHIAGRPAGQVAAIELVDGQATATLEVDDDVWPLPKGTTARPRWGSTTSYLSRYIELYPGKADAGNLSDGAILSRNRSAVELDEAFRIFRGKTDEHTRALVDELGDTLHGQGDDLKRGVAAAPRGLDATGDLLRELSADEERLRTLAVSGDRATTALASRADDLRALVSSAAGTVEELAEHTRAQQESLDRAPRTFDASTLTLARLDTSLSHLDALVADVRPGAPALRSLAETTRGTLSELRRVAPLAASTLDRGTAAAPRLVRLFDTATPFFPDAKAALETFNPMLACLRPYGPEIAGFLETWTGQIKNYDAEGHYARSFPLTVIPALLPGTMNSPTQALALAPGLTYAMPRPPGLNAGKPWLQPQCGAGDAALDPSKDPEAAR